jgi:hypothetical protein
MSQIPQDIQHIVAALRARLEAEYGGWAHVSLSIHDIGDRDLEFYAAQHDLVVDILRAGYRATQLRDGETAIALFAAQKSPDAAVAAAEASETIESPASAGRLLTII